MKTSEKFLTFAAIFISCLALVVSIFQTRIMQKQSEAAVWPRLTNSQSHGSEHFVYTIRNEGVGPAIIKSIKYIYRDTSFQEISALVNYFAELEVKEIKENIDLNFTYGNLAAGSVIGVGDKHEVFVAKDSTSITLGKKYLLKTNLRLDYCSIYEDCWRMLNDDIIVLD